MHRTPACVLMGLTSTAVLTVTLLSPESDCAVPLLIGVTGRNRARLVRQGFWIPR